MTSPACNDTGIPKASGNEQPGTATTCLTNRDASGGSFVPYNVSKRKPSRSPSLVWNEFCEVQSDAIDCGSKVEDHDSDYAC